MGNGAVRALDVTNGPRIFRVPNTLGVALAVAAAAGSPSLSSEVTFRFPWATFVAGVLVMLDPDGVAATMAEQFGPVGLTITDETAQPMVGDTRGTLRGSTSAPVSARLLAMQGMGFRPFALQRPVEAGDQWIFRFQNESTVQIATVEGLYLFLEDPS